ncbi:MAG: hypothetical protein Q8Q08_10720 [Candidatus Omnitrophota bacterium]|nr:hypothetical protein [Candidatus Omnitrophota bacterium]
MRILHLPTSVGGNSWGLSRAERDLGLDSQTLVTRDNWLKYPSDICLHWEKNAFPGIALSAVKTFWDIRKKFDVFHFNFGSTLIDFRRLGIHHWDLPFYPKGKKLIVTYNGCDARQKFKITGARKTGGCPIRDCCGKKFCGLTDHMKRHRIRIMAGHAHHIFALNPDLLHYLPSGKSSFLPYTIANWNSLTPSLRLREAKIKIVHSPTNTQIKGTDLVLESIGRLRPRYNLDVQIVQNVPHEEALKIYENADLVIDQLLVGWYGGFSVEAMRMGKAVAVYINTDDLKFIPEDMARDLLEAVINVNPANLTETLSLYLENPELLSRKARAGMDYVNTWHDPARIANITRSFYHP